MLVAKYHRRFRRQFNKLPLSTQEKFRQRLNLFLADNRHPLLNIHALRGEYADCLSMNIGGDYRAIFRYQDNKSSVVFLEIGTHSQLYN